MSISSYLDSIYAILSKLDYFKKVTPQFILNTSDYIGVKVFWLHLFWWDSDSIRFTSEQIKRFNLSFWIYTNYISFKNNIDYIAKKIAKS